MRKVLIAILVLIIGLLGYASTKPDQFRVERSIVIKAPAEKIFPHINNFHQWEAWSPYEKLDPAMKRNFSGTGVGVGAIYAWDGNSDVGAGRMEILESTPSSAIKIKLDFLKPIEGHDMAEFTLAPEGDGTKVTWAMSGPAAYIMKVMSVFLDMDHMIGKDFEAGLNNLKALIEQ
jgi:uncharacterized protein YndB with AHSA1/START domain